MAIGDKQTHPVTDGRSFVRQIKGVGVGEAVGSGVGEGLTVGNGTTDPVIPVRSSAPGAVETIGSISLVVVTAVTVGSAIVEGVWPLSYIDTVPVGDNLMK